jgi:hypothetical protein
MAVPRIPKCHLAVPMTLIYRQAIMASYLHQEMYLQQLASLVRIQGSENGQPSGPALAIDLKSGNIGVVDGSRPLAQEEGAQKIYGVIGLQQLVAGFALAVVTSVKQVSKPCHREEILSPSFASRRCTERDFEVRLFCGASGRVYLEAYCSKNPTVVQLCFSMSNSMVCGQGKIKSLCLPPVLTRRTSRFPVHLIR